MLGQDLWEHDSLRLVLWNRYAVIRFCNFGLCSKAQYFAPKGNFIFGQPPSKLEEYFSEIESKRLWDQKRVFHSDLPNGPSDIKELYTSLNSLYVHTMGYFYSRFSFGLFTWPANSRSISSPRTTLKEKEKGSEEENLKEKVSYVYVLALALHIKKAHECFSITFHVSFALSFENAVQRRKMCLCASMTRARIRNFLFSFLFEINSHSS